MQVALVCNCHVKKSSTQSSSVRIEGSEPQKAIVENVAAEKFGVNCKMMDMTEGGKESAKYSLVGMNDEQLCTISFDGGKW